LIDFEFDAENMVIESVEAKANYLLSELSSVGIQPKRTSEPHDKGELEALVTAIKEVYFHDYKIAYNDTSSNTEEIDQSHFGHLL
jgi:hypothetical protein